MGQIPEQFRPKFDAPENKVLGDAEVTANLYCNLRFRIGKVVRFAVYICGNFLVTKYNVYRVPGGIAVYRVPGGIAVYSVPGWIAV